MAGEKKNLRKCACCGREFEPRDSRNTYCTDPYCKSMARSENQKKIFRARSKWAEDPEKKRTCKL